MLFSLILFFSVFVIVFVLLRLKTGKSIFIWLSVIFSGIGIVTITAFIVISWAANKVADKVGSVVADFFSPDQIHYTIGNFSEKDTILKIKLPVNPVHQLRINSSFGGEFLFFKLKCKKEEILSSIRHAKEGKRAEEHIRKVGWPRLQYEMTFLKDTFPGQLKFWDVADVKQKQCYMFMADNVTHCLVYDSVRQTAYYIQRPPWEHEVFRTFNRKIIELDNMLPDSVKDIVPYEFYGDFGFRDFWHYPLRYPWAIDFVDTEEDAHFLGLASHDKTPSNFMVHPQKFNFEKDYLVAYCSTDSARIRKEPVYIIIHLNTSEYEYFKTEAQVKKRAKKLKIKNETLTLLTFKEYDETF